MYNSSQAGQRPAFLSCQRCDALAKCVAPENRMTLKRMSTHLEKAGKNWYNLSNSQIHRSATIAAQAPLLRHRSVAQRTGDLELPCERS